jgi:outer membrane protein assembly factor BamE (lipoprotein component of BamABCDE complex)/ketosteroid isomerase-like protein
MRYWLILLSFLLAGCGAGLPSVKPFKMDIQQGNVVTSKMLLELRPGMTKSQVRYILGTPLIVDSFHQGRWDYFYQLRQKGKVVEQRRVILNFEKDLLANIKGDVIPAGKTIAEAAAETGAKSVTAARAPEKKPLLERLKFWKSDDKTLEKLDVPKDLTKDASDKQLPNIELGSEKVVEAVVNAPTVAPVVAVNAAEVAAESTQATVEGVSILATPIEDKIQLGSSNVDMPKNTDLPTVEMQKAETPTAGMREPALSSSVATPAEPQTVIAVAPIDAATITTAEKPMKDTSASVDANQLVQETVTAWADAWRTKKIGPYLDFYASDFKPDGMPSKNAWVAQRKNRLSAKQGAITLAIEDLNVTVNDNKASATFTQKYSAKSYADQVQKRLDFSWNASRNRWLIVKETVLLDAQKPASAAVIAPEESSEHLDGLIEKIGF